jgi:hypothetical protein
VGDRELLEDISEHEGSSFSRSHDFRRRVRDIFFEVSSKLFLAKPQRREDSVFKSFCDFAFLRETHFWDYSEVSNDFNKKEPAAILRLALLL